MKKPQHGGTLLGLAFGLVVGVLISFGVVWYLNKTPLPFVERVTQPEAKANDQQTPLALPGKPGDKPAERKFEFYDILEGKKGAAPTGAPPVADPTAAAAPLIPPVVAPPVAESGSGLMLQVGAFQKPADAENLKARLAMLGLEASVQATEIPEKGTMHRVRVGPYASAEKMNQVRGQLSDNGIPATVVRIKEQQ